MPRYRYGARRKQAPVVVEPAHKPEPTYHDLQLEAKALGIPANQSADELRDAISEGHSDE